MSDFMACWIKVNFKHVLPVKPQLELIREIKSLGEINLTSFYCFSRKSDLPSEMIYLLSNFVFFASFFFTERPSIKF